jgi:hypothetical protein
VTTRTPPATLVVRPLGPEHDDAVRATFRSTLVLGAAAPFELPDLDHYEDLCLGWYLGPGRRWAAVVVDDEGRTAGYLLACPDPTSHGRWVRSRAVRFTARVLLGLVTRRYPPEASTFWRLRLQDGWVAWRHGAPDPFPMHVHLNLVPGVRATQAGRLLVRHADTVCRAEGGTGWFGEVNAPAGRRAAALERLGGRVVHRTPNRTFSWVRGGPVERLTVVRVLPVEADGATAPEAAATSATAPTTDQSSRVARRRAIVPSSTPMPAT